MVKKAAVRLMSPDSRIFSSKWPRPKAMIEVRAFPYVSKSSEIDPHKIMPIIPKLTTIGINVKIYFRKTTPAYCED